MATDPKPSTIPTRMCSTDDAKDLKRAYQDLTEQLNTLGQKLAQSPS